MPQIAEGGMEHDVCFFDDGNDTAGRDRPSGTGSAAVCAAAVRRTGDHGVSPVVSDAHCMADGIFFVLVGLVALSWVVSLIRVVREMVV